MASMQAGGVLDLVKSTPKDWFDLEPEIRKRTQYVVLDTIGVALAGFDEEASRQVRSLFRQGRPGPLDTALMLGVAAQALDLDETNLIAGCHIAAAILPAMVAAAAGRSMTGPAFLAAFAEAYRFTARLGASIGPRHSARGWHSSATIGTFGAAYGAALVLGLDATSRVAAVGIATSQAAGVRGIFGGSAKPLNFGRAAQSGLMCALLAAAGMSVPGDAIESRQGFFAASGVLPGDIPDARHPILDNHFKFLPFCIETHAAAYAAAQIVKIADVSDCSRVDVYMSPTARPLVDKPKASTMHEARFSVQYVVAQALFREALSVRSKVFCPGFASTPPIRLLEAADLGHLMARVVVHSGQQERSSAQYDFGVTGQLDTSAIERKVTDITAPFASSFAGGLMELVFEMEKSNDVSVEIGKVLSAMSIAEISNSGKEATNISWILKPSTTVN